MFNKTIAILCVICFALVYIAFIDAWHASERAKTKGRMFQVRQEFFIFYDKQCKFPPRYKITHGSKVGWNVILSEGDQQSCPASNPDVTLSQEEILQRGYVPYPLNYSGKSITEFVAVSNSDSILGNNMAFSLEDVRDGVSNTLLVAEVYQSNLIASEYRDMPIDNFLNLCLRKGANRSDSEDTAGFRGQLLLFADGSIAEIIKPLPKSTWVGLWTKDSSDGISRDNLVKSGLIVLKKTGLVSQLDCTTKAGLAD